MGSEFDAEKDLELRDADAASVTGGRITPTKKSLAARRQKQHAASRSTPAVTAVIKITAPPTGDPGVAAGESQAELDSDPDC